MVPCVYYNTDRVLMPDHTGDQHMLDLDNAQIAAVLAGLRLLQKQGCPDALEDIATNGGEFDLPGDDFIDELCEKINLGE